MYDNHGDAGYDDDILAIKLASSTPASALAQKKLSIRLDTSIKWGLCSASLSCWTWYWFNGDAG